jgi:energy-coupling factor transporter ATP-binding protein EcfA2
MLAVVFGASGSGKSTQAALLRELLPDVAVHDWDEVGGSPPPKNWRQRGNREWIDRACRGDFDFLVLGGVPGEVLAAPGAVELDGLAFCLLDCADDERVRRLSEREGETHSRRTSSGITLRGESGCGSMRRTQAWWTGPIRREDEGFAWSRWESWRAGDPRWSIARIDTTGRRPRETAGELAAWFRARRAERDAGTLPLSGRWWDG